MRKLLPVLFFTIMIFISKKSYSQDEKFNFFGLKEIDVISFLKGERSFKFHDRTEYETDIELMYMQNIGKGVILTHVYHFSKTHGKCYKMTELYEKEMFDSVVTIMDEKPNNIRVPNALEWINNESYIKTQVKVSKTFCAVSYQYTGMLR